MNTSTHRQTGPQQRRPVDLKRSLILRIALVACACLALVTAIVLVETHQDARQRAATTADRSRRAPARLSIAAHQCRPRSVEPLPGLGNGDQQHGRRRTVRPLLRYQG
ncbi:MAG: hypothetical protein WDN31_10230 [Hyphomicrobium sp.]